MTLARTERLWSSSTRGFLLLVSGCSILLGSCNAQRAQVGELIRSNSGVVTEARNQAAATVELGKIGIQKATDTVKDVQQRVDQLQQGVTKIEDGRAQVEKAMAK